MQGTVLYFGRHKGKPLGEIPADYLVWALKTVKLSSGIRRAIEDELQARGAAMPIPPPPAANPNACWRGPCSRCGCKALAYSWHEFSNGQRRIRAACPRCGHWCGHAPHVEPYLSLATASASPTATLDALLLAEEEGVELVSDGRAVRVEPWHQGSERLKDLVRQQSHLLASLLGDTTREN